MVQAQINKLQELPYGAISSCDKAKKVKHHQSKRKRSVSQPIYLQTPRTPEITVQYDNMLIAETRLEGTIDCHVSYHDCTKPARVHISIS